ncbi:MAG TPA: hypothetical protein VLT83_08150, partial [Opitutaceae bacterium]|nr:hypothetical protein [Opitutaceae bacterium]
MSGPHRRLGVILLAALAAGGGLQGAATTRNFSATGTELYVDNIDCGPVKKWEGGTLVGEVTEEASGNVIKKQISQVSYSPITLEVAAALARPLVDWINDLCSGGDATKTVLLVDAAATSNGTATGLTAVDARLVEVDIPDLDASSKDTLYLKLVIVPGRTTVGPATNPPAVPGQRVKVLLAADFQLQIGDLDTSTVSKISAFTITNQPVSDQAGHRPSVTLEPGGATHFSNLMLEMSPTAAITANWMAWRKDFLLDGNNGDAAEKDATLTLGAPNGPTVLTLHFSHLGLVRAWQNASSGKENADKLQAELYYEKVTFSGSGAAPLATAAAAAAGAAAPLTASTPATEVQPATLAAATAAPGPAADAGERDPADFPRYPGSVRKSYTIVRQVGTSAEYVVYETSDPAKAVADFFSKHLAAAGWNQTLMNQSTDSDNKPVFVQTWQKATRTAMVSA